MTNQWLPNGQLCGRKRWLTLQQIQPPDRGQRKPPFERRTQFFSSLYWLVVEPYPSEKLWSESQLGWLFHSIPNWMESHQKFHENSNGSSHHQSDQSVYAEQHPNSQDNQKSLLLLSQWIIGSLCEAQMSPQVPLDAKNEAQIAGGWWRFMYSPLQAQWFAQWLDEFHSIPFSEWTVLPAISSLLRLQTARPRHSKLRARCQNPVLPEFLQRRKGGIILPLCLLQQKHDSPLGLICPNPWDVPKLMGQPRSIASKHIII